MKYKNTWCSAPFLTFLMSMFFAACTGGLPNGGKCVISGQLPDASRDGQYIFLVPVEHEDSLGVDSVLIRDGRFVFETEKRMLGVLRVALKHRYGLQDLLVVTEPGNVNVTIGLESFGSGTPANDILQQWKDGTTAFRANMGIIYAQRRALDNADTAAIKALAHRADSTGKAYQQYVGNLMRTMDDGPLKDFFAKQFPALR